MDDYCTNPEYFDCAVWPHAKLGPAIQTRKGYVRKCPRCGKKYLNERTVWQMNQDEINHNKPA